MKNEVFENCKDFFNNLILNELLLISNNGFFLGGGALRDYFCGIIDKKKYSDIDIWVKSKESLNLIIKYFESKDAILKDSSESFKVYHLNGIYYDLHHWKYFDSPIDAMQYVDITVNCCFFDGESFLYPCDYFLHLKNKMIVWNCFNGYNIDLINERINKMIKKGFRVSKEEFERIKKEIQ